MIFKEICKLYVDNDEGEECSIIIQNPWDENNIQTIKKNIMSLFKPFAEAVNNQFQIMCETKKLFRVKVTGREIWDKYLTSFDNVDNPIWRDPESTTHNCNNCNNFIRRYGNVVAIDDNGKIISMFDNIKIGNHYDTIAEKLSIFITSSEIVEVFFETFNSLNSINYEQCKSTNNVFQLGIIKNVKRYTKEEAELYGVVKPNEIKTFYHFNVQLPNQFVDTSDKSVEAIIAEYRDKYSVFKRAMEEISLDTLNLVKDLINQGSLLDGTAHLHSIEEIIAHKKLFSMYNKIPTDIDYWNISYTIEERTAKFRNTLIGVLCTELSEGEELNKACQNWNKRVDPINYHKVTAPITKKQIEAAKTFVIDNGYEESFIRRCAVKDDVKASEILHLNSGDGTIEGVSIFDNVKSTSTRHKRSTFNNIEEVSIEKFMMDILPNCSSVEAFLTNAMINNMVTMTTSNVIDSKPIFKWDNNYSWTFNGNLAGKSQIKQAVKLAGGVVDGVLNFRLAWNDENKMDESDLDAWALEPNNTKIGYSTSYRLDKGNVRTSMSGQLDVDNMHPNDKIAVENITWINKSKMIDGTYTLWVHQFSARNSQGFKAEIEFDGEIFSYEYNRPVTGNIKVAIVTLKDGNFSIKHLLPETNSTKELWGLETNNFHKVNLMCLSPNHWGNNVVGNKHYFFMLDGCKVESNIRTFHNENLLTKLLEHKKVMEVLGSSNMIEPKGEQLSGIGFNSTVRDELIVKCSGTFKRMLKIKF